MYTGNPYHFSADGSSGFPAESNRYHLYVSLACPWAHRTLIVRKLKGLDNIISCTVVDWLLTEKGWSFTDKVSLIVVKLPSCYFVVHVHICTVSTI